MSHAFDDTYDMRDDLNPRRLTIVMWDHAFLFRHVPGGSFEDYDRVLNEAVERGYNTLRIDPLPANIDLADPDKILEFKGPTPTYQPWGRITDVEGPVGRWLIEFVEKAQDRGLYFTLSPWWGETPMKQADVWLKFLDHWERLFGLDRIVYVDLINEFPCFMGGAQKVFNDETGKGWDYSPEQKPLAAKMLNEALAHLSKNRPELRYTVSIHGDHRWLDVPLEMDCMDIHFYADADIRWCHRSGFYDFMSQGVIFKETGWFKEFSDRCTKAGKSMAPMFRQRQRQVLKKFARWSLEKGMPLTTSESWSCWYYYDHPDLDWRWLLDWAERSVEDAIDFKMWGWTPHNYCQPQFANWQDASWHRRLTDRFLRS